MNRQEYGDALTEEQKYWRSLLPRVICEIGTGPLSDDNGEFSDKMIDRLKEVMDGRG